MPALLLVAYFGIGLMQLAAVMGGLEDRMGLHWIIAAPIVNATASPNEDLRASMSTASYFLALPNCKYSIS